MITKVIMIRVFQFSLNQNLFLNNLGILKINEQGQEINEQIDKTTAL
jgi:hypothetical protein